MDAHCHINKEGGKARDGDLLQPEQELFGLDQAERVFAAEKVRQHHKKRNAGADGGCQSRAVDPHITGEDEEIIAKDVKDAAGQYAEGRQPRRIVIPQKRRQQLIEQEKRENILDGPHIALRQRKQRFIRAEEGQDRALKAQDPDPCQNGQKHCADHRGGKILMFASVAFSAAAPCAEDHAAADAHQKAKAVDDVPYRRDDCQRRRSLRPVVLPDHCRVYDGIDRGDHCAAKRGRQVFEVHRFDVSVQEVHAAFLLLHEKNRTKNRHLSLSLVRLSFL